ncbi:M20/M25/M40 family metallo-hydrolase [Henriciella sp.]|uniref:M20/M25/M40 family metallo-hydrolase n=1 Tax=Henriciella sp. TaxID=1968823 RepID=UPI0026344844|nr:M20/M25/M40 family metallo-hydrolase [Henriciella sp.]
MISRLSLLVSVAALAIAPAAAAQERTAHEEMARDIYENVVEIRTARGQEKVPEMVSYLSEQLSKAGFSDEDIQVRDYDNDGEATQGLMVWYRADGEAEQKPIVILAHMDVVDALAKDWERAPFELTEEDGYFFGRGTADNKYGVANLVSTFIRLKEEGWSPNRDIVLAFSGDEETGMVSTRAQAKYTAENIDPAFVLNSDAGGGALGEDGKALYYSVQAAEKTYATFELTINNPGGHSSRPRDDNAIYELADALKKIEAHKFPVRSSELTRAYFEAASARKGGVLGAAMAAFAENPDNEDAIAALRANPETRGTTGTTCVATMLEAGHAENALPQSATATVNCRIFPGVGIDATEATLKEVVDNEDVKFELISDLVESPESQVPDEVVSALEVALAERGMELDIFPHMSSGGTDGMHYRNRGYDTVGISGAFAKSGDTYAHGLNERLPVDSFYDGLDHWYVILKELAGS